MISAILVNWKKVMRHPVWKNLSVLTVGAFFLNLVKIQMKSLFLSNKKFKKITYHITDMGEKQNNKSVLNLISPLLNKKHMK